MEAPKKVPVLIAYAPPDKQKYVDPLVDHLARLHDEHEYLTVHHILMGNDSASQSNNLRRLEQAGILIIFLSKSFLRGNFFRRLLQDDLSWHMRSNVSVLLTHPCPWEEEQFFLPAQKQLKRMPTLQRLYAQKQYPRFVAQFAEQIAATASMIAEVE